METIATTDVVLYFTRAGGWDGGFRVVFEGPDADARAAAWIAGKRGGHIDLAEDFDWEPAAIPLTMEALDPRCEHGLSSSLCAGPGHYPPGL